MPTYCYKRPDGDIIDVFFDAGEAPDQVQCSDNVVAERCLAAEINGQRAAGDAIRRLYPVHSKSAGVSPKQVGSDGRYKDDEMKSRFPDHEFHPETGDMIFDGPEEQKRQLSDIGMERM